MTDNVIDIKMYLCIRRQVIMWHFTVGVFVCRQAFCELLQLIMKRCSASERSESETRSQRSSFVFAHHLQNNATRATVISTKINANVSFYPPRRCYNEVLSLYRCKTPINIPQLTKKKQSPRKVTTSNLNFTTFSASFVLLRLTEHCFGLRHLRP